MAGQEVRPKVEEGYVASSIHRVHSHIRFRRHSVDGDAADCVGIFSFSDLFFRFRHRTLCPFTMCISGFI